MLNQNQNEFKRKQKKTGSRKLLEIKGGIKYQENGKFQALRPKGKDFMAGLKLAKLR